LDKKKPTDGAYEVGYGKPPVKTRFKPGQSGNPRGRPKKAKNINALIQAELNKTIAITENGRTKRITKRQAIIMQLINRAIKGETKPLQMMFAHLHNTSEPDPFVSTAADDAELMRALGGDGTDLDESAVLEVCGDGDG